MKTTEADNMPSSATEEFPPAINASVDPAIWIGICAEAVPALAVTVAVRLDRLPTPEEKVKVAEPSVPVVTV
jgi:hypothetical protein